MIRRLVRPFLALSLGFGLLTFTTGCIPGMSFFQDPAAVVMDDLLFAVSQRTTELEEKADSEGLSKAEKKELKALKKVNARTEGIYDSDATVSKQVKLIGKLINDVRKAKSPDEDVQLRSQDAIRFFLFLALQIRAETDARQSDISEKDNKRIDQLQSKASKAAARADEAGEQGNDTKAEKLHLKANKFEAKAFDRADKLVR